MKIYPHPVLHVGAFASVRHHTPPGGNPRADHRVYGTAGFRMTLHMRGRRGWWYFDLGPEWW